MRDYFFTYKVFFLIEPMLILVVGRLYSIQYRDILGTPDKVRCYTCEEARPSRLDFQRDEVKIHHVISSMQDCWS
jgi:hypothetical protein